MKLRLWPRSLIGQLVFAVAVMLFVAQAVNFALLVRGQKQQTLAHGGGMAVARIIDAVDRDRRGDFRGDPREARAGSRDRRDEPQERERAQKLVISDAPVPVPTGAVRMPELADYVADLLNEADVSAQSVDAWALPQRPRLRANFPGRTVIVSAQIDRRYFAVRSRIPTGGNRLQGFLVWQTLSLYLLLLIPIMVIAWRAAAPLRDLTRAARSNPALRDATPLEEEGPSDVRDLIIAFNAYRGRIATMLSDKDRMLGAVGHDLRTPLASLRVRVEQVEDDALRDKMIASIEEMAAMLTDILALARSGAGTEGREPVALRGLIEELAADYRERGKDVSVAAAVDAAVMARPLLLRRALRNLIDNAAAYGQRARLSVERGQGEVRIIVSDDGPGLTDEQIRTLVEPFARGEQSRNRATGGSGLGLSIARDIAEGEGGTLTLRNRDGGGLDAVVALPTA
ncbi:MULTISPECIES: sensor histidine kinase [unclassified Sphingopyxis]|uniref:sensor histidine kinase n=1 Tax=unclassified Sphingopyxis TaxID=2614943 RepID=UPI0025DC4C78|nr:MULTISPECIES: HAMP domain-containing sensor histidine kinase [unclassified Sphingopyxis]